MSRLFNGGNLVTGVVLVILGLVIVIGLLDWLIKVAGFAILVIGIVLVIMALLDKSGGKSKSSSGGW